MSQYFQVLLRLSSHNFAADRGAETSETSSEGNVHSARRWRDVLDPILSRYGATGVRRYFRADAAFAKPDIYEYLEERRVFYAIRLPSVGCQRFWTVLGPRDWGEEAPGLRVSLTS